MVNGCEELCGSALIWNHVHLSPCIDVHLPPTDSMAIISLN